MKSGNPAPTHTQKSSSKSTGGTAGVRRYGLILTQHPWGKVSLLLRNTFLQFTKKQNTLQFVAMWELLWSQVRVKRWVIHSQVTRSPDSTFQSHSHRHKRTTILPADHWKYQGSVYMVDMLKTSGMLRYYSFCGNIYILVSGFLKNVFRYSQWNIYRWNYSLSLLKNIKEFFKLGE